MKTVWFVALVAVLGMGTVFPAINEKKVENAKESAAKSGKLIAFVFYQAYWDPNCPKCVATVNANNAAVKKVVPRQNTVVIEVVGKEKDVRAILPPVVSMDGPTPRVVVTDAACGTVVAEMKPGMGKADLDAFGKKVKDAVTSQR